MLLSSRALLSLVFIALSATDATPLSRRTGKATLSFTRRINELPAGVTIADRDRARAQTMSNASRVVKRKQPKCIDVVNDAEVYVAQVGVGAGTYTLLIDTGSSNTWVGANSSNPYRPGRDAKDTGNGVTVRYGLGDFSGEEWIDTVTLSSGLVIKQQSIGAASSSNSFAGFDGILGVGPTDLTSRTVANTQTVPTVMDNLKTQGTISKEVLGIYYVPFSEQNNGGVLTFGGYDDWAITTPVNYVPITKTAPAMYYWGIDQSIKYGDTTIQSQSAGIVDTGTTLVLMSPDAFTAYQKATGATLDQTTGLLVIDQSQYSALQSLYYQIGGTTYELTPDAQTWPRALISYIGGNADSIYLVVASLGSAAQPGFEFVDGYAFLERFYSVYDTTNQQVGLAETWFTYSQSNQGW